MIFICPDITKHNMRCVYKLQFEDGSFYIGSTCNLRQRVGNYKSAFKNSIGSVNKLLAKKAEDYDIIWVIILEIVPLTHNPKEYENYWIKSFGHCMNILNRSRSAYSNSGMVKSR